MKVIILMCREFIWRRGGLELFNILLLCNDDLCCEDDGEFNNVMD